MIIQATEKEVPQLGLLWAKLVEEENPKADPDIESWMEFEKKLLSLDSYYAYVFKINDEVVGFCDGLLLIDLETRQKYIKGGHLYVLPEHRKGSAGMRLHLKSFRKSKELGAKFLRRTVSANNMRMMKRAKDMKVSSYIIDEEIK